MFRYTLCGISAMFAVASAGRGFTGEPVLSGYWPSYAASLLQAEDINYDQFTHIDWFVASTANSYELELFGGESSLRKLVRLAHAANVTVSMSIGGWVGSIWFSDLVSNSTGRTAFANSINNYIQDFDLDGVDLDWEFPGTQGIGCNTIRPEDPDNFLEFLSVLRNVVGPDIRLSSAVGVGVWDIKGPDGVTMYNRTGELANYLDYVTLMVYDIYNVFAPTTGPLGPLYDDCATDIWIGASGASAAQKWVNAGFPVNKLLMGMPAYSHDYIVSSSNLASFTRGGKTSLMYQRKTSDVPDGGVTSSGAGKDTCGADFPAVSSWLFRELISSGKLDSTGLQSRGSWTRYFDECSQTPFLFNNQTREFIAYDDPQSYSVKAEFARRHGMAGINVFDLTGDTGDNKLMKAARSQLIGNFNDVGSATTFDGASPTAVPVAGSPGDAPDSAYRRAQPPLLFTTVRHFLQNWRL